MSKRNKRHKNKKGKKSTNTVGDLDTGLIDTAFDALVDVGKSVVNTVKSGKTSFKGGYKACYHSHAALKIGKWEIYGGSCSSPIVDDADIYIGLDYGMKLTSKSLPWNGVKEIGLTITDYQAPDKDQSEDFIKLSTWTVNQLRAGKKVHVGCIGGHGRTGMFLAAVTFLMTKDPKAIEYVRQNYCEKAVESAAQIDFLVKHYGMDKAKPAKQQTYVPATTTYKGPYSKNVGSTIYNSDDLIDTSGPISVSWSMWRGELDGEVDCIWET